MYCNGANEPVLSDSYREMYCAVKHWLEETPLRYENLAELEQFAINLPLQMHESIEDLKQDRQISRVATIDATWDYLSNEVFFMREQIYALETEAVQQSCQLDSVVLDEAIKAVDAARDSLRIRTFLFTLYCLAFARETLTNLTALYTSSDLHQKASCILEDSGIAFDILARAAQEESRKIVGSRMSL